MNRRLSSIAARQASAFTRSQASDCGYHDDEVRRLVRSGEWLRLRRGAYTLRTPFESLDAAGRHRVLVHAVMASLGGNVAVSHTSAAAIYGLPTWGLDLSRVHVTRLDAGASRIERDVRHHVGDMAPTGIVCHDGLPIVPPGRAVVEVATIAPFEPSVVVADCALHLNMTTKEELHDLLERIRSWPGARSASAVVPFADGRAESPGESRNRVLCYDEDLPIPDLQCEIYDASGQLVGRVDMVFWKERTIGEFDGKLKYQGDDAGERTFQEKRREDRLRELGFEVVRVTWSDLDYPRHTAMRIRRAFERARARQIALPQRS